MAQHILMDTASGEPKARLKGNEYGAALVTLVDPTTGLPYAAGGSSGGGGAVTVADGDDVALGATDDSAASSDSGTFSLIALVKRLLGKLPASLGAKAPTASLSTVPAVGTLTNRSGTITTGGAAQQVAASNSSRIGFSLQNLSTGDLWFTTLGTAAAAQPSIKLASGAYFEAPAGYGGTGAISIYGDTTGQAFAAREW